jgi:hypothetical protein
VNEDEGCAVLGAGAVGLGDGPQEYAGGAQLEKMGRACCRGAG